MTEMTNHGMVTVYSSPSASKNPKKSNHQTKIVRIQEIRTHQNADTLEIIPIGGYQVVVKKGEFSVGQLGVYIQPDSVVPQTAPFQFLWSQYADTAAALVPERKRRITVRKFRGEWSEGLLLPVFDFDVFIDKTTENGVVRYGTVDNLQGYGEGDDVSDLLGITHYDPDAGNENTQGSLLSHAPKRKKRYPKTVRGWFFYLVHKLGISWGTRGPNEDVDFHLPVYDVEAFKNYPNVFEEGEQVIVTEKIHGSNARYVFLDGKMYAGSRQLWKAPDSSCIWRKALKEIPWIEEWCRAHEGFALYGEVTPTQKGFDYGTKSIQFFVFDVRKPDGSWESELPPYTGIRYVPCLYFGPFDKEKIATLVEGKTHAQDGDLVRKADHIREGIVVRPWKERTAHGLGRAQLKLVSNAFLEKDSK